jgi:hypothetical protein
MNGMVILAGDEQIFGGHLSSLPFPAGLRRARKSMRKIKIVVRAAPGLKTSAATVSELQSNALPPKFFRSS